MGAPLIDFNLGSARCTVMADTMQGNRNVVLVDTTDARILIDAGAGRAYEANPGQLLERMRVAGIDPHTVETVILSHADFDHIGGTIDEGLPSFRNARHYILKTELDFWHGRPDRLRASSSYDESFRQWGNSTPPMVIDLLGPLIEPVASGYEVARGVTMRHAPGHTPGNAIIRIAAGERDLLVVGDLLYRPENIEDPDWVSPYDYDPAQVVQTRQALLAQAAESHALLLAYHMPFPGLGTVAGQGAAWRWSATSPT